MARYSRTGERRQRPGKAPEEDRETYTPPKDELGTSDEIVHQGRQEYATEKVPSWPQADSARQYVATLEGMHEIQHGVVTWIGAADASPRNEDIERRDEPGRRKKSTKPPEYEL